MKTLKRMIILIMVFIIIILIVVLGLLNKYGKKEESDKDSYENGADQVNINTELNEVTEPTYYYTVYSCLENYIKSVTTKLEEFDAENYIPGGEMNYFEMLGIQTENEKNQYIYNLLDSNYIRENNITINNINQYVESNKLNINFNIEKMYEMLNERVYQYVVYIRTNENSKLCFLISLDTQNLTYMIRPVQYIEYDNLKKEDIYENIEEIKENENNVYDYTRISNEEMAKKYFYDFKYNIINNPNYIYNKLEKEYRDERFENLNKFYEYVEDDKENLSDISLNKYSVNVYDKYTEYVCKDQYDNIYIFKADAVMDYNIILDTYTIKSDKFKEEYEKSNAEKKVQMNIDKFIQMLNIHDYTTSYNCLSDSFKNNYFNSQEEFKKYIKNNLFAHNKLNFKGFEEKENNIYVTTIQLSDLTKESSENKEMTIIMQLKEDMNFVMSFSIE